MTSIQNSQKEIRFLEREEVEIMHARLVTLYGGSHGLRDSHLLESSLAQPTVSFGGNYLHSSIYDMAAAYLFHVVQNHAFVDGNKRIGFACMDTFLRLNSYELLMDSEDAYTMVLKVAQGSLNKKEIAAILKEKCTAISE